MLLDIQLGGLETIIAAVSFGIAVGTAVVSGVGGTIGVFRFLKKTFTALISEPIGKLKEELTKRLDRHERDIARHEEDITEFRVDLHHLQDESEYMREAQLEQRRETQLLREQFNRFEK